MRGRVVWWAGCAVLWQGGCAGQGAPVAQGCGQGSPEDLTQLFFMRAVDAARNEVNSLGSLL